MRRLLSFTLFALTTSTLACGGEPFDISQPAPETSIESDDSATDAPLDTATNDKTDAGDDTTREDTATPADTTPADTGTADTADTRDTCIANACGGCAALAHAVGSACGSCDDGKYACDGLDAVKCVGARALNACGGCGVLDHTLDSACGACGGGKWVCDGVDRTKCMDPVTTAPNTPCGICGTQKFVCAGDGKSTYCSNTDDRNACGGCGVLASAPGSACGACGVSTCRSDKAAVVCTEAAPAIGTVCGLCSKSSYTCSSTGVTTCAKPDDRQALSWGPLDTTVGTVDVLTPRIAYGVELTAPKTATITTVRVAIARTPYDCADTTSVPHPDPACTRCKYSLSLGGYSCSVEFPVTGTLTARVFVGAPGSLGASVAGTLVANDVTLSSPGMAWVDLKLASALNVNAGDKLYVELTSDSTAYKFTWNRSPTVVGKSERAWRRVPLSSSDWVTWVNTSRPLQLLANTCDY